MAFTIAHMAAALPFYPAKRWLQFDALLIGTMVPDLPYYIGSSDATGDLSHQWIGIFTYNLPWGLLIFVLWYWGLKPATYALIQPFLKKSINARIDNKDISYNENGNKGQRRVTGYADRYWSFASFKKRFKYGPSIFYLSAVFGLILGAFTHVVWDGITHADGLIARHIDWLQYPVYFYPFKGTSIARLLQYLSSIAGLAILFWFVLSRLQVRQRSSGSLDRRALAMDDPTRPRLTKKQSLLIVGVFALASLVLFMRAAVEWYPSLFSSPYSFAAGVTVSVLPSIAILYIGYAIIYHLIVFLRAGYVRRKRY